MDIHGFPVEQYVPDLTEEDKQGHVALGAAVAAGSALGLYLVWPEAPRWARIVIPTVAASVVGVVKEAEDSYDPLHHTVDAKDAVATGFGGFVTAVGISFTF
jgi:predicted aconitase